MLVLRLYAESVAGYALRFTGEYALDLGKVKLMVDLKYYRTTEVGDATNAMIKLGWFPRYN